MKGYVKKCLIGQISFDPRVKYGSLYTSDAWKSRLDAMWRFLGAESKIPVDVSENERYYIIYTSLKEFALRGVFIVGAVALYLVLMKSCVV